MTPAARAAAAIAVLDDILEGIAAEVALTRWGRNSRYAGSGDRAAVRDLVYAALRQRRSAAALGGSLTGRGLVLGLARAQGTDALWFDGSTHGPAQAEEESRLPSEAEATDLPDWLIPAMKQSLGDDFSTIVSAMKDRAPVYLRVNQARLSPAAAIAALAAEAIQAKQNPLANFGLEVTEGARKISNSKAYLDGLVELQDVSSQAVVEALPLADGMKVLDHCAGGGGKALAMAARARLTLFAHDHFPRRMADLPARAARAKARVTLTETPEKTAPYDLILTDVPCSGSGSWRRDPEGKWRLTPALLAEIQTIQSEILERTAPMVAEGGTLAYATCSFLRSENEDQVAAFLARHPDWACNLQRRFSPLDGGDGFFLAILQRK